MQRHPDIHPVLQQTHNYNIHNTNGVSIDQMDTDSLSQSIFLTDNLP